MSDIDRKPNIEPKKSDPGVSSIPPKKSSSKATTPTKTSSTKTSSTKTSSASSKLVLTLDVEDFAGFAATMRDAAELPRPSDRRTATLEAIADLLDLATPAGALLPPPLGTLVDDVLDIDGKLFDAVVQWAGALFTGKGEGDRLEAWRSRRAERRARRSTNAARR